MTGVLRRPLVRIRRKFFSHVFSPDLMVNKANEFLDIRMLNFVRNKFLNLSTFISMLEIAPTNSEVSSRRGHRDEVRGPEVRSDAAVAVLSKSTRDSDAKATLACVLPWGHGFGWSTLPNGVWSGGK